MFIHRSLKTVHKSLRTAGLSTACPQGSHCLLWIDLLLQYLDGILKRIVFLNITCNLLGSVNDGGVVPSSKVTSDGLERGIRHIPAKVHDNLSGIYNFLVTLLGGDIKGGESIMVRHNLDDKVWGDLPLGIGRYDVLKGFFRQLQGNVALVKAGQGNDFGQRAFQLTDIGFDVGGNVFDYLVINIISFHLLFFAQDCHSCLIIRRLDIHGKSPFKTGAQAFLQCLNFFWRFIRGDYNLLLGFI